MIRVGGAGTWTGRLLRVLAGLAVGLAIVEGTVRASWNAVPDALHPATAVHVETVTGVDGKPHERMWGNDLYHRFRHNHRGYRGPEYGDRVAGTPRIALVGDSFVYGIGVSEQDAVPGQLQALLRTRAPGTEVINGGTPGAGLDHHVDRVAGVIRDYRPDAVVLVLLYNDFEFADTQVNAGATFDTAGVRPTGDVNRVGALAQALLPVTDPRFGTGVTASAAGNPPWHVSLRYAIARRWHTYAYAALHARMLGTDWDSATRDFTLLHVDSAQVRRLAYGRLVEALRGLRALGEREGVRVGISVFMDGNLTGTPALRIREAIAAAGVPSLDLAPLWGTLSEYARKHSLRYDNHPNRRANRAAATLLACWVAGNGWLGTPGMDSDAACMTRHAARVERYLEAQRVAGAEQRAYLATLERGFQGALTGDERDPDVRRRQANQWLFGWIPDDATRRIVNEGGALLRAGNEGARLVQVVGRGLDAGVRGVSVTCGAETRGVPLDGPVPFDVTLPVDVAPGSVIECVVRPERAGAARGPSLQVTRIALR